MKTFQVIYYKQPRASDPVTENHRYTESWEVTDWHCPKCANKTVWEEQGAGDYDLGTQFLCTSCGFSFHMPNASMIGDRPKRLLDSYDWQRLEHLRSA